MPDYSKLTQEELDKMPVEERYPDWKPFDPPKSGPYRILWDTPTPTSHTRLGQKEIWISQLDVKKRPESTLAHEIAHSRLLKTSGELGIMEDPEISKVSAWRELEAVLLTLGKDQPTDPWVVGYVLLDISREFGDGSAKDGKRIAKIVAKRMGDRNYLTKMEVKAVSSKISRMRLKLSDYN